MTDQQEGSKTSPPGTAAGLRWSSIGLAGTESIRAVSGIALAALLGPRNYGIVGQATVFIVLTGVFVDQGFSAALIRKPVLRREDQGTVLLCALTAAVTGALATVALAPLVADFFRTPELTSVLRVLAITILVKGLATVPMALVNRAMRFRRLALAELSAAIVSVVVGLAAALAGAEYWSIVAMTMAFDLVLLIAVAPAAGRPVVAWSRESFQELFSFSANSMGFQLLNYASRNLDNVIIGRALGPAALAYYSISYRVMMLPIIGLGRVVNRVTLPIYSRLQDRRDLLRYHYVRGTQTLAAASFPLMIVVIVLAPVAIPYVLGPEWAPAILPMQILAFTGMRQAVGVLGGNILLACGRADWQFRFGLLSTALTVASFFVGIQWGIVGVALAYTIASAALMPVMAILVGRLIDLSLLQWFGALAPATASGLVAGTTGAGLVWGAEAADLGAWPTMVAGALGVVGSFFGTLRLGWRDEFRELRSVATMLVGRSPSPV